MNREKLLQHLGILIFLTQISYSQVGIGTTTPTAQLEIDASATPTMPPFKIVPSVMPPTGTSSGQIAIIDNSLYIYDATRSKWLSSEVSVFSWGNNGATDNEYLEYATTNASNSGAKIPVNATIVAVTIQTATSSTDNARQFTIRKNNPSVDVVHFTTATFTYNSILVNTDVNAGDFLQVFVNNEFNEVNSPIVTLWLKWRK